jgi:hypothetical protein
MDTNDQKIKKLHQNYVALCGLHTKREVLQTKMKKKNYSFGAIINVMDPNPK